MVERRYLVHLREREAHFPGERREMRGREMPVAVLDAVQVLDQQIGAARRVTEQRLNLIQRLGIDLSALQRTARPLLPRGVTARGFTAPAALRCAIVHSLRFYSGASMTGP